jgi:hypothetical protein
MLSVKDGLMLAEGGKPDTEVKKPKIKAGPSEAGDTGG